MLELTKKPTMGKFAEICLRVPAKDAAKVASATVQFLRLAGHEVRVRDMAEEAEDLIPAREVFPDSHPGRILRGLRVREDLTQAALAAKAGLKAQHMSEMEHGKRPNGTEVARRLADAPNASYQMLR